MTLSSSSTSSFSSATVPAPLPAADFDKPRRRRSATLRFRDSEDDSGAAETPASAVYTEDMKELEREMWERFHKAGFWRSPSLKEP